MVDRHRPDLECRGDLDQLLPLSVDRKTAPGPDPQKIVSWAFNAIALI
jgi:hypothetical protein